MIAVDAVALSGVYCFIGRPLQPSSHSFGCFMVAGSNCKVDEARFWRFYSVLSPPHAANRRSTYGLLFYVPCFYYRSDFRLWFCAGHPHQPPTATGRSQATRFDTGRRETGRARQSPSTPISARSLSLVSLINALNRSMTKVLSRMRS